MVKQSDSERDLKQFYRLLADYGLTGNTQNGKRMLRVDNDQASDVFPD